jgi:hypothetical protein
MPPGGIQGWADPMKTSAAQGRCDSVSLPVVEAAEVDELSSLLLGSPMPWEVGLIQVPVGEHQVGFLQRIASSGCDSEDLLQGFGGSEGELDFWRRACLAQEGRNPPVPFGKGDGRCWYRLALHGRGAQGERRWMVRIERGRARGDRARKPYGQTLPGSYPLSGTLAAGLRQPQLQDPPDQEDDDDSQKLFAGCGGKNQNETEGSSGRSQFSPHAAISRRSIGSPDASGNSPCLLVQNMHKAGLGVAVLRPPHLRPPS